MSPFRTAYSCGISSRCVSRRTRPTRVTRGSTPPSSLIFAPVSSSAFSTIDRNSNTSNVSPNTALRSFLYSTDPSSSTLIGTATARSPDSTPPTPQPKTPRRTPFHHIVPDVPRLHIHVHQPPHVRPRNQHLVSGIAGTFASTPCFKHASSAPKNSAGWCARTPAPPCPRRTPRARPQGSHHVPRAFHTLRSGQEYRYVDNGL